MSCELPVSFHEIVDDIITFTSLPRSEVEQRVWMEALQTGWNVANDAPLFHVRPHIYDAAMADLYRDGISFIFETMVYWAHPARQQWIRHALKRLRRYADEHARSAGQLNVLLVGDGTGNDSLYLAKNGLKVTYFDVPGSKTSEFATRRFEHYCRAETNTTVEIETDYKRLLCGKYDAVISFEVLEHLVDPVAAISDMNLMLKPGGVAIVTETFALVTKELPTHLESNLRYDGSTPFLFLKNDLALTWYSRDPIFKPMEFTKTPGVSTSTYRRLALVKDGNVLVHYLDAKARSVRRTLGRALCRTPS